MYHYKECGLSYVYLVNGYQTEVIDGEEYVSIEAMDDLHRLIARLITRKRTPMTGEEVKFLRLELAMSQKSLSELMGVDVQTVARWEKGVSDVSRIVDVTIRSLYLESLDKGGPLGQMLKLLSECDTIEAQEKLEFHSENDQWFASG